MTIHQIEQLLSLKPNNPERDLLFHQATLIRRQINNSKVYIRAVIELSNHCICSCNFCGNAIAASIPRYRLSYDEVCAQIDYARTLGIDMIHLASGEDPGFDFSTLIKIIQYAASLNMTVELALGKMTSEKYQRLFEAGAQRYILKFETSNPTLFSRVKQCRGNLDNVLHHHQLLKQTGFQIGTGNIIGLPGQSLSDIASDLYYLCASQYDMVSTSVFTPNAESVYKHQKPGDANTALNYLALLRILINNNITIPTNSTLGVLGKTEALKLGANEISLNLTPSRTQSSYSLYSGKDRFRSSFSQTLEFIDNAGLELSTYKEVILHG